MNWLDNIFATPLDLQQTDERPVVPTITWHGSDSSNPRSKPLGPNQLAWCRANLGNFQKYESQVLASKGETLREKK